MKTLLAQFEKKAPEIVFEWNDTETSARGWVVINSLRGGAAGGGTRMRQGLDRNEVESLAKTMEIKFTVSGPLIGGAKSGIDFDPQDPRKHAVLRRWYKAVAPLLKSYYGTGGDLNIDDRHEVAPITESHGLWHPQEGVVNGHYGEAGAKHLVQRIGQLRLGVSKIVEDPRYTPAPNGKYTVADLITGWGVTESARHYYATYGGDLADKRVIVQGWGNVGAAAAYYAARSGAHVVGVIDRSGGLVNPAGYSADAVRALFLAKQGNTLRADDIVPFDQINDTIWDTGAEVFLPCAASRLVTREHVDRLTANGLEVIASGANVPFADPDIFYGPVYEHADHSVAVVPDFIANCGMARTFALLMQGNLEISDESIFEDISSTIEAALKHCHARSQAPTRVASTAFAIALDQLL